MSDNLSEVLFISRPSFHSPGEERGEGSEPGSLCVDSLGHEMPLELPFAHVFEPDQAKELGPEFFRVDYRFHMFMPVLLNVMLHAEGSDVKLSWNPADSYSFRHDVDLEAFRLQANEPAVWSTRHKLAIRASWTLEWWKPPTYRVVDRMYPPPGPFLNLCISILKAAGFDFDTRIAPTKSHEYLTRNCSPTELGKQGIYNFETDPALPARPSLSDF